MRFKFACKTSVKGWARRLHKASRVLVVRGLGTFPRRRDKGVERVYGQMAAVSSPQPGPAANRGADAGSIEQSSWRKAACVLREVAEVSPQRERTFMCVVVLLLGGMGLDWCG